MAMNLIDAVKDYITPELLNLASSRMGETDTSVSRGLNAAIPLIMGALAQKSSTDPGLMAQVMGLLTDRANTSDILGNLRGVLAGDPSTAPNTSLGSSLLSTIFGPQLGSVTSVLGEHAGVKSASASSIMTVAATMITALLGNTVRRDGLSASGLLSLLSGQRDSILGARPSGLAGVGGVGAVRGLGEGAVTT